jgi:hypothetical protein
MDQPIAREDGIKTLEAYSHDACFGKKCFAAVVSAIRASVWGA